MHNAAGRFAQGEPNLIADIAALVDLLYRGPAEVQAASRAGLQWHPAGVLMEQLVANLTIVYSLQKVGGTTIAATLNAHPAVRPEALHLHYLSAKGLRDLQGQIDACSHPNVGYLLGHLAQCRGTRALLAANRALRTGGAGPVVRKPFLIAGMRDPVALSLSLAFEGLSLSDRLGLLDDEFLRRWVMDSSAVEYCDYWFREELAEVFGVDVYARTFPAERGWDIYENDEARALVVRQEDLDRLPEALGALFGLEPSGFAVKTCNVGAHKDYADHYARAKRALRLTEAELDRLYGTRSARHFYTNEEIARFRSHWSAGRHDTEPARPAAPKPAAKVSPQPAPAAVPEPHIWGCRPCWRCQAQLNSIPGLQHTCTSLQHTCAVQSARIDQLEAAHEAVQVPPPRPGLLRALTQRVPKPLRTLAKRVIQFGR